MSHTSETLHADAYLLDLLDSSITDSCVTIEAEIATKTWFLQSKRLQHFTMPITSRIGLKINKRFNS